MHSIARTHHERYDGSGYPQGLAGKDIPLEGRITAVADVFDALLTERNYRSAFPVDEAVAVIREGRGGEPCSIPGSSTSSWITSKGA